MAEKFKVSKKWGKAFGGYVIRTDIRVNYACEGYEEADGWLSLTDLVKGTITLNKAHVVSIEKAKFIIDVKNRLFQFNEKDEIKETEEENNGVYQQDGESWHWISMCNYLWRP